MMYFHLRLIEFSTKVIWKTCVYKYHIILPIYYKIYKKNERPRTEINAMKVFTEKNCKQ